MSRYATAIIALLFALATLLTITSWAARRTHNATDFLLAHRRLGPWQLTAGYAANALNPWLLMMLGAAAFTWGYAALWIWGAAVFCSIVSFWYIAPRMRASSVGHSNLTLIQVVSADAGERLHPLVVRSAVFIALVALLLQIAASLRLAASGLGGLGFADDSIVLSLLAVVGISVFAGGLRSVSISEGVQSVLMLVLIVAVLAPALTVLGGWTGLQSAFATLDAVATDGYGGKAQMAAVAFAAGLFALGCSAWGQPQIVNRYVAAYDEASVRIARWIAPLWIGLILGACVLCAWCARASFADLVNPEQALYVLAQRMLTEQSAAVFAVALSAIVAASAASQLLAIMTGFSVDLKRPTSALSLPWMRTALVLAILLAGTVSLYRWPDLFEHALFAYSVLGASFGSLILVRLSGKRIRPGSTLGAMWAGFLLSLLFHVLPDSPGDFLERVLPFVAALGIALTGGERRRNPDRADRAEETVHDRMAI